MIADIRKHPHKGLGKPEALKYDFAGYWSRRITQEHRLFYKMGEEDNVVVFQCRFHYSK
ncbi:MAG: Txe/YoeB family addiction module toxin [Chitinophagales bacterium]